jgi:aspartate aminotransferase-like enzyme
VSNLTSPGDKVLVLTAGKFGERWTGLAKAFGCNVDVLSVPYGETFSLEAIRSRVTSDVRAVFVQATESSTGARHDVEAIAKIVRAHGDGTLLVVDAITGLGTTHLNVDSWGVDVIIGGSQKALMMPPGLAYCAVSRRGTTLICARNGSQRPRENQLIRRRLRCLRRWERRSRLCGAWGAAIWSKAGKNWSTMPRFVRR